MRKIIILLIILIIGTNLYSQTDSNKFFKTEDFSVYFLEKTKVKNRFISEYVIMGEFNLVNIKGDTLIFKADKDIKEILKFNYIEEIDITNRATKNGIKIIYKDINKISFYNGRSFLSGAGYGAISGFVLGTLFGGLMAGVAPHPTKVKLGEILPGMLLVGTIGSLTGGLIGGLIGLLVPDFKEYKLHTLERNKKKRVLSKLFKKYKLKAKNK